jgi:hypothetical protein
LKNGQIFEESIQFCSIPGYEIAYVALLENKHWVKETLWPPETPYPDPATKSIVRKFSQGAKTYFSPFLMYDYIVGKSFSSIKKHQTGSNIVR